MKKVMTVVVFVNLYCLSSAQWIDNGDIMLTQDYIWIQNNNGVWFGDPEANAITSNNTGFLELWRNASNINRSISIDDDSGNFYLHPTGPVGSTVPAGTTVDLIFQTDQTTNINSRAGYINSNLGGLFVTAGTGILGLFGNSNLNLGSGSGVISLSNNTKVDINSPEIELTPTIGPTYFLVDSNGVRIDGESMSWQVDEINIESNNPIDVEVDLHGNLNISGAIFGLSDKRLKTEIQPMQNALDMILSMEPKKFSYDKKNDENHNNVHYGLIAQELETILPELVRGDNSKENYKSINYQEVIPFLIGAIREQQDQIEELKQKLSER